jgi:hypothetical protein
MRLRSAILLLFLPCVYSQPPTVYVNGTKIGAEPGLNFSPAGGITWACLDNHSANRVDCTTSFNSALIPTHDTVHANENFCDSSNGTTAYTCTILPKNLIQYATGMIFLLRADASCSSACTLNMDGIGVRTIKQADGATDPNIAAHQPYWIFYDGVIFRLISAAGGSASAANAAVTDQRGDVRARRVIGAMDTMTFAANMNLDVTAGDLHKTTTANSVGNATINASTGGLPGQHMWIIIVNDQISAKTITLGSNLRGAGTLTGTAGKTTTLQFVSDGNAWYEVGRTQGL